MVNLYRKYRPKNFSQLIGQNEIKDILISELKNDHVSHAYLFAGMRGCGKTTTARILAKALNCTSLKDNYEPCNECDNCKAINSGSFPDVIEMDAASNRGIDEIRSIKEGVNFVPAIGNYKIYIIDEVHMLTQQAFNALLKTLEEPPEHTVFILATTEINKVPQTIISRCQVLSFKPHNIEDVIENLVYICDSENYKYEKEALNIIAKKGEGSMRDSIGILEQVAIFSEGNLAKNNVLNLLGDVEEEILDRFVSYILDKNRKKVEEVLKEIYMSGKNMEIFLKDLIYRLNERIEKGENLYKLLVFFVNAYKDINYFFDKNIFIKAKTFEFMDTLKQSSEDIKVKKPEFEKSEVEQVRAKRAVQTDTKTHDSQPILQKESVVEDEKKDLNEETLKISSEKPKENTNIKEIIPVKETKSDEKIEENPDFPQYWVEVNKNLKKDNIALYTLITKATPEFYDDKVVLLYPSKENFSYQTISSKLDDVKALLSKYGFDKEIVVIKGKENLQDIPEEVKDILKLFGGSIERE